MKEYTELCDLIRNSNTDTVLEYIRTMNFDMDMYYEMWARPMPFYESPLGLAVKHGHLLAVNELIRIGFDLYISSRIDNQRVSPFYLAFQYNRLDIIHCLLHDHEADINRVDDNGYTTLVRTITYCTITYSPEDTLDAVKALVEAGASVNISCRVRGMEITALSEAIVRHRVDVCRYLISKGADVNARNVLYQNVTHLMEAIERGAGIDIMRLLLESGADINAFNARGTSLMYAINASRNFHKVLEIDVVRMLLEYGADVNVFDNFNISPLRYATGNYYTNQYDHSIVDETVKELVKSGANVNVLDSDLLSPLMDILKPDKASIEVIRLLIESGADVNASDSDSKTPLLHAVEFAARAEVIEYLVESGADVNVLDKYNKSPLWYAISGYWNRQHQEDTVKALVRLGADVNVSGSNQVSLLTCAIRTCVKIDVIRLLVESGADVTLLDGNNKSPFQYAIENNMTEAIDHLIKPVFTCNLASSPFRKFGESAHFDKDYHLALVQLLLPSEANVHCLDSNHKSPLHHALGNSLSMHIGIIQLFIDSGADVNIQDDKGDSPLMYALRNDGSVEVLLLLLESLIDSGADVNIQDDKGDSPLMYALKNDARVEVLLLLLESGADVCACNRDNICPLSFVVRQFNSFACMVKEGEVHSYNLVQVFVDSATDVKGLVVTLPTVTRGIIDLHAFLDAIRPLCSKGADIEGKDEMDNSFLQQVMTFLSKCCCGKCFNLLHLLIVELNLSPCVRNRNNKTPFSCVLSMLWIHSIGNLWVVSNILKLCVQAGYTPNSEEMAVVREIEELLLTDIKRSDVTSLLDMCCFSVRRALGRRLPTAVNSLHIPETLKQRVKLTHVHPVDENTVDCNPAADASDAAVAAADVDADVAAAVVAAAVVATAAAAAADDDE